MIKLSATDFLSEQQEDTFYVDRPVCPLCGAAVFSPAALFGMFLQTWPVLAATEQPVCEKCAEDVSPDLYRQWAQDRDRQVTEYGGQMAVVMAAETVAHRLTELLDGQDVGPDVWHLLNREDIAAAILLLHEALFEHWQETEDE